jgi:hypothetical protein
MRFVGAAALIVASLSRYEPWPVVAVFAAVSLWDARKTPSLAWGALACAGPAAWLVHNAVAHGDAFHFAARISSYRQALGSASERGGYPLALLREEPELVLVAAAMLAGALLQRRRLAPSLARNAGAFAVLLAALSLAAIPGGAPTHHAGRALLAIWLCIAIYVGAGAQSIMRTPMRRAFATIVLLAVPLGAFVIRPFFGGSRYSARRDETAIGRELAAIVPAGERVLVEAVDYGYFAIIAASARRPDIVVDRSLDPRGTIAPSSFATLESLRRRADSEHARYVVGTLESAASELGTPRARAGVWGLWQLE